MTLNDMDKVLTGYVVFMEDMSHIIYNILTLHFTLYMSNGITDTKPSYYMLLYAMFFMFILCF